MTWKLAVKQRGRSRCYSEIPLLLLLLLAASCAGSRWGQTADALPLRGLVKGLLGSLFVLMHARRVYIYTRVQSECSHKQRFCSPVKCSQLLFCVLNFPGILTPCPSASCALTLPLPLWSVTSCDVHAEGQLSHLPERRHRTSWLTSQ